MTNLTAVWRCTNRKLAATAWSVIVLLAAETAVELVSRRSGLAEGRRPKRLVINLLVDFLHSCRIFRCSWGVSLARFGSEGEEFFETTRRGRVDESQGKLFPSSVPFRREVIPTDGKDTVSRRKPAS